VDVTDSRHNPAQIAPVVTWLASPAASEITGQIIDVMQGWVGIMQQPAVIRSFRADRLWTLEDLDQVLPALMGAKRAHDERVKKEGEPELI
jgi:NAD(P)-dependent dehydrogenase (short-subunit alcohol dehydrogenase family)